MKTKLPEMLLPEVRYIRFDRRKGKTVGFWNAPKEEPGQPPPGRIELDTRETPPEQLDTLVHELLHETFRDTTEEKVADSATLIARVLWREGYRKVIQ